MPRGDLLASGARSATFHTSDSITQKHWDSIWAEDGNLVSEEKTPAELEAEKANVEFKHVHNHI